MLYLWRLWKLFLCYSSLFTNKRFETLTFNKTTCSVSLIYLSLQKDFSANLLCNQNFTIHRKLGELRRVFLWVFPPSGFKQLKGKGLVLGSSRWYVEWFRTLDPSYLRFIRLLRKVESSHTSSWLSFPSHWVVVFDSPPGAECVQYKSGLGLII